MSELSRPLSNVFKYAPLTDPSREIRLLRPLSRWKNLARGASLAAGSRHMRENSDLSDLPTLWEIVHEKIPIGEETSYYCLSYAWDRQDQTHSVVVDKTTIPISRSLHEALRACRKLCDNLNLQPWALWVDSICINQEDLVERSFQVLQMRKIYEHASWVLVWLGPDADDSAWAMERMESISNKGAEYELWKIAVEDWPNVTSDIDPAGKARIAKLNRYLQEAVKVYTSSPDGPLFPILKLMERSYWERLWVLQEVAVAANAVLLCGSKTVTWRRFRLAIQIHQLVGLTLKHDGLFDRKARSEFGLIQRRVTPLLLACDNVEQAKQPFTAYKLKTLKALLVETSFNYKLQTSDPRDRVFALLGMAADQKKLEIPVDYFMTVEEVYIDVARAILLTGIGKGRLNLLSYCMPIEDFKASDGLPSWVPDWRRPIPSPISPTGDPRKKGMYFMEPPEPQTVEFKLSETIGPVLVVQGYQLDTVRLLGDVFPSSEGREETRIHGLIEWLEQLMFLADTGSEELASQEAREEAVLRTAVADWEFEPTGETLQRATEQSINDIYKILTGTIRPPGYSAEVQRQWILEKTRSYRLAMDWSATQRRTFATSGRRIGLGPEFLRGGDTIVELPGSDVPLALRKDQSGRFWIVGEVYVHGVMDGEHRHRYFETLSWPKLITFEIC